MLSLNKAALSALVLSAGVAAQVCPSLSQFIITGCGYGCYATCDNANEGHLLQTVNGCFHDAWGFGKFGLFGDVQVGLWICDDPCGCTNTTGDCSLGCRQISWTRLDDNGSCSAGSGCLELSGNTNRCCPEVLKAGGFECVLYFANNCDRGPAEVYGEDVLPEGCRPEVANNTRCTLTQTSAGNTGYFPPGCTISTVCEADTIPNPPSVATDAPSETKSSLTNAPTSSQNPSTATDAPTEEDTEENLPPPPPTNDDSDWVNWEAISAVSATVGLVGGCLVWCLRHHRTQTLLRMCTTEEFMKVKIHNVTSPVYDSPTKCVKEIDVSQASQDETMDTPSRSLPVPHTIRQGVFVQDNVSAISSHVIAENRSALLRDGWGVVGDVLAIFKDCNVKATADIRLAAKVFDKKPGMPTPSWVEVFGFTRSSGGLPEGTNIGALMLPERDFMFDNFEYDGQERMTWRALPDGRSVLCVFNPSTILWKPRIRGRLAVWEMEI